MTLRYLATAGRTILSKAGFVADGSLDDQHKIFDSNWNFSAVVIKSGEMADPAPIYSASGFPRPSNTTSSAPIVINFTDPGYVPCAYLISESNPAAFNAGGSPLTRGFNGFRGVAPIGGSKSTPHGAEPTVTRSQIIIPRAVSPDIAGTYVRYGGIIRYVVFGISQ